MYTVGGKDLEDEQKEVFSNAEWKDRVEKWKTRQEKRGLVTRFDDDNKGGADNEDDDFL